MKLSTYLKWPTAGLTVAAVLACGGSWAMAEERSAARQEVLVPLSLPLDAYQMSPAQHAEQANLDNIVVRVCMRSYGISYLTDVPDIRQRFVAYVAAADSRRYGISDLSSAQERGYHLPPVLLPEDDKTTSTATETLTHEQERVLTGQPAAKQSATRKDAGEYAGKAILEGGCVGESTRILNQSAAAHHETTLFAAGLQHQIYGRTQQHPDTLAVFKRWSDCMAESGYRYSGPIAAATDPTWDLAGPATPEEIKTAVADVTCKQRTNLVAIAHEVESDLQRKAIATHAPRLAPLKDVVQAQLVAIERAKVTYAS
ncbi:hypothetical protein OG339_27970 [Streptosporangium sp. NBC_01495]|uniref:hypothetical protein n=1 Tax=Streptosporangium sp. NBC_01495 TaxID=2903899 RepID=UPI002E30E08F|nr:hypothetical protein [Streptosporangium sp. NBC_01495]